MPDLGDLIDDHYDGKHENDLAAMRADRDREKKRADQNAARLVSESKELLARIEQLERLDQISVRAPRWTAPKGKNNNRATAMLMLSDCHFDEVVNPLELVGSSGQAINAYDRKIGERRLRRTFEGAITVAELMSGFAYDGIVVQLGGDIVSGSIHDELKETNDGASVLDTVDHFIDPIAAGLAMLADHFGKVHVVGCTGNHGRTTRKPEAKRRVRSNYDWFLNRQLARHFAVDDRFTFNLPDTADVYWSVYGHQHLLTHGDQARGGSGISKLMTPVSLLDFRKKSRDAAIADFEGHGRVYSHMWIGHWHTYLQVATTTVNGSLKGLDEYAFQGNFGFEPPAQAFAVITPQYNVTTQAAVYPQDRRQEGW